MSADSFDIANAKKLLADNGYVVLKAKSYRQAQERQRIAQIFREDAEERAASQDKWWREEILPELFYYRDRVSFLYGEARAAGRTVEQLRQVVAPDSPPGKRGNQ